MNVEIKTKPDIFMIYSSLRIYLVLLCLLYTFIFIESAKMCIMLFKEI